MRRVLLTLLRWLTSRSLADEIYGDLEELRRRQGIRTRFGIASFYVRSLFSVVLAVLFARFTTDPDPLARRSLSFDSLRSDLWHTWRSTRHRPGATVATVAVIALGLGLVSAMFALADPFILRALPYKAPDSLVVIDLRLAQRASGAAIPTIDAWRARRDLFVDVAAYRVDAPLRLKLSNGSVFLSTAAVTDNFLNVLGLPSFPSPEWRSAKGDVDVPLLLTESAPTELREAVALSDRTPVIQGGGSVRVLGTLPPSFLFPRHGTTGRVAALRMFGPIDLIEDVERSPTGMAISSRPLSVIARVRPGLSAADVQRALTSGSAANAGPDVSVRPLVEEMTAPVRPIAFGALAAGALILLACAANIANLQVARGVYRSSEIATREALGANRFDLFRLLFTELGILTGCGCVAALALAHIVLKLATLVIPPEYASLGSAAVTGRVVLFALASSGLVLLSGLIPGWMCWRSASPAISARSESRGTRELRSIRFSMAAGQTAVAVMLLLGAALVGRSYFSLLAQDSGYGRTSITLSVSYPPELNGLRLREDIDRTLERLSRVSGVTAVAAASGAMVNEARATIGGLLIGGRGIPPVEAKFVTPSYFTAAGTPLLSGRAFNLQDDRSDVAIVNQSFASQYLEGTRAEQMIVAGQHTRRIVGVTANSYDVALDTRPEPTIYLPLANRAYSARVTYVLSLQESRIALGGALRREISAVNPEAVLVDEALLRDRLLATVRQRSFAALILGLFALAAVSVTAAGLIGIVSFVVARRTREMAIRTALGATSLNVLGLVMRDALAAAIVGTVLGVVCSRWVDQFLASLVYGISPSDWPTTFFVVVFMLSSVATFSWLPARRALRLPPTIALRVE